MPNYYKFVEIEFIIDGNSQMRLGLAASDRMK